MRKNEERQEKRRRNIRTRLDTQGERAREILKS